MPHACAYPHLRTCLYVHYMHIYGRVYMCVYTHVDTHVYLLVCAWVRPSLNWCSREHAPVHVCMQVYRCLCTCLQVSRPTSAYMLSCVPTYMSTCKSVCASTHRSKHACLHAPLHTCLLHVPRVRTCVYTHMYTHVYTYIYLRVLCTAA